MNLSKLAYPIIAGFLLIFVSTILSEVLKIYDYIPWIDKTYHFLGGFIAAWAWWIYVRSGLKHSGAINRLVIVLSGVALVGVLWEFAEYTSSALDFYLAIEGYLYIGTLRDTVFDLFLDLIGAATFAGLSGLKQETLSHES